MTSKNIVFLINLHIPYIKFDKALSGKYDEETNLVFGYISNCLLPLLRMLSKFEKEGLKARLALVFSTSVCAFLSDEDIQKKYNKYLDNLIEFGKKEVARTKRDQAGCKAAQACLECAVQNKKDFNELYGGNLIKAFSDFALRGYVEILATCGSYMFMPHFADMTEILNAQVESGLYAIKNYFDILPDGFFLPEMGYAPGVEEVIKSYGVSYTILPAESFLFSSVAPKNGIFMPARTQNGLLIFASDKLSEECLMSPVYKDVSKDASWELSAKELTPFIKEGKSRFASGFCYQNRGEEKYNVDAAQTQAVTDAETFVEQKSAMLDKAKIILGDDAEVSVGLVFDYEHLFGKWAEGIVWLESAVRAACSKGMGVVSYGDLISGKFGAQKISPYPASFCESTYGENLISSKNSWMLRYARKSCERIVDLVSRFPGDGGLKARLLNLGARELLLALDCSLPKMVDSNYFADFASEFFKRGIVSFSNVYDALGTNSVSTEWFCALEKLHPLFPWMNYRIFSKKR